MNLLIYHFSYYSTALVMLQYYAKTAKLSQNSFTSTDSVIILDFRTKLHSKILTASTWRERQIQQVEYKHSSF